MLRLNLMGPFSIERDRPITLHNKKAQALLAFLALAPGASHARERLATLLWPDSNDEASRQSLRQCVSTLRREVDDLPLAVDYDTLGFEPGSIAVDVAEFNDALAASSLENLKRAATLYRGHLLEELNARSDLFEEWLRSERSSLRASAMSAFHALLDQLQSAGAREEAIVVALRLLAIDPLQEQVDRTLMRLSYRVATRRHCLILLKNRSIKFRARYRYGLKQIGSLRFRFGGMFAHAPYWRANSLIQSASYPRSAINIVCGSRALRRTEHSRLSCASPCVRARWTGRPLVSTTA
jgi:DNA-binding SARP family transcriptional activator